MILFTAASLLATLALAAPSATANPGAPRLDDPRLSHRSAFRQSPLTHLDPPAQDWRQSNDTVRKLGGHAGHLRAQRVDNLPEIARPSAATTLGKP